MNRAAIRVAAAAIVTALTFSACGVLPDSKPESKPSAKKSVDRYELKRGEGLYKLELERKETYRQGAITTMILVDDKPGRKVKQKDQSWIVRSDVLYDPALDRIAFKLEYYDLVLSGRILGDSFFAKVKYDGSPPPCWFESSLKEMNSVPNCPFQLDLDRNPTAVSMLKTGKVRSWTIDPEFAANYKLTVDVDMLALIETFFPGVLAQRGKLSALDTVSTTVWMDDGIINLVEFDMLPVLKVLTDRDVKGIEDLVDLEDLHPNGWIEFDSLPTNFDVKRPAKVCAKRDFSLSV